MTYEQLAEYARSLDGVGRTSEARAYMAEAERRRRNGVPEPGASREKEVRMRKLYATRRRKLVAVLAVLALLVVSAAFAAWIVGARSGARAQTATIVSPTVVPTATPNGNLFAGGSVPLAVDVTNPTSNPPLNLVSIATTNVSTTDIVSSNEAGCPDANFTVGQSAQTGLSIPVANTGLPIKVNLPGQTLNLAANAPTACMGVTVTVSAGGTNGWDLSFSP